MASHSMRSRPAADRGLPLDVKQTGGERGLVLAGAAATAGIWRRAGEREIVGIFWSFYFLIGCRGPAFNDIISWTEVVLVL